MASVVSKVMATVNASYQVAVTHTELATKIANPESASTFDAAVFAFLSEVHPGLQTEFLKEMGVDIADVSKVAKAYSDVAGYSLPLAD